jgi:predicted nuclease with TOPRIM domain
MRLSKTVWIILGVVVFVIGAVYLYMMYARQLDEQEQLKSKLATNQATLPRLIAERENWQSQLDKLQNEIAQRQAALTEANLALSQAKEGWPESAESIEYDEKLFAIADAWKLDITVVTAAEPKEVRVEGITFTVASFNVEVKGRLPETTPEEEADYRDYIYKAVGDILHFIDTVVNDKDFASASIELVTMQVPQPLTKEQLAEEGLEVEKPTAQINLIIYTYKGG